MRTKFKCGHPISPRNSYVNHDCYLRCRICQTEAAKRWNTIHRAGKPRPDNRKGDRAYLDWHIAYRKWKHGKGPKPVYPRRNQWRDDLAPVVFKYALVKRRFLDPQS